MIFYVIHGDASHLRWKIFFILQASFCINAPTSGIKTQNLILLIQQYYQSIIPKIWSRLHESFYSTRLRVISIVKFQNSNILYNCFHHIQTGLCLNLVTSWTMILTFLLTDAHKDLHCIHPNYHNRFIHFILNCNNF